jgi:hypothetical protein
MRPETKKHKPFGHRAKSLTLGIGVGKAMSSPDGDIGKTAYQIHGR